MNETIQQQLIKYAEKDLTEARKNGVIIYGTKKGCIEIRYDKEQRVYTFVMDNGMLIHTWKKKQAVIYLLENYVVTMGE